MEISESFYCNYKLKEQLMQDIELEIQVTKGEILEGQATGPSIQSSLASLQAIKADNERIQNHFVSLQTERQQLLMALAENGREDEICELERRMRHIICNTINVSTDKMDEMIDLAVIE